MQQRCHLLYGKQASDKNSLFNRLFHMCYVFYGSMWAGLEQLQGLTLQCKVSSACTFNSRPLFLNHRAVAWYQALASIIPDHERFSCNWFIHSLVFSLEGRAWQEPEHSHVTGMAWAHCILGKFLGVVCYCFPPPLDVPTLAARCLHPQRHKRS